MIKSADTKELPKGWALTKLGDICEIQGGSQPPKKHFIYEPKSGYIQLLQIRDFGDKPVPTYVPISKVSKFCKKQDVLIARYGASLGRIVTGMEGAYNVALAKVIFNHDLIFNKFFFYILKTPIFQTPIHMISRSAQNGFNTSEVYPIRIPFPPLNEQKRIVAKIEELFTRLDAGVEALKKVKAELKRYRQAVLKYAFEGKLTEKWRQEHKGQLEPASKLLERIAKEREKIGGKQKKLPPLDKSNLPKLPDGWEWVKLEIVITKISNGITNRQTKDGVGTPVTRIETISDSEFNLKKVGYLQEITLETIEKYKLLENDILFSNINSDLHLGKTAIFNIPNITVLHGMNLLLLRPDTKAIVPKWFNFLLNYYRFSGYFVSIAQHAVNQSSINQAKLKNVPICLPSLAEQKCIVQEIERHFSIADQIEQAIERGLRQAERLRQSILKRAFEGKLTEKWRQENPDLISGENSAEALLERIKAEKAKLQTKQKVKKKK